MALFIVGIVLIICGITLKVSKVMPSATAPAVSCSSSRTLYEGPKGGKYYINARGRKVYVRQSPDDDPMREIHRIADARYERALKAIAEGNVSRY